MFSCEGNYKENVVENMFIEQCTAKQQLVP